MKRWICMMLAVLLVFSGCSKKVEPTTKRDPVKFSDGSVVRSSEDGSVTRVETQPDPSGADAPTPDKTPDQGGSANAGVAEDTPVEALVTDYCDRQLHYADKYGSSVDCSFRVPQINLYSWDAGTVNDELETLAKEVISQAQEAAKARTGLNDQGISYDSWKLDGMLVVLVTVENLWDCNRYFAYVFDLETGARLDNEAVAARLGLAEEALMEKLAAAAEQEYRTTYEGMEDMDARFYEMQLSRTVETENLNEAQIYPDQNGKLMAVANIFSLAGEDAYVHNFALQ